MNNSQEMNGLAHFAEREDQGIDFRIYIRFVQRWRNVLLLGALLGILVGTGLALEQQPMFSSTMSLQFNERQSEMMGGMAGDPFGFGKRGNGASRAIPVLKSRFLAEKVAKKLALNAVVIKNSDVSFRKSLQRRLIGWINPPPDLAHAGWSGAIRYYLGRLVGDPGPIGSIQLANLSVAPRLADQPFVFTLNTDGRHFKLFNADGDLLVDGKTGIPVSIKVGGEPLRFTMVSLNPGFATRLRVRFRSPLAAARMVRGSLKVKAMFGHPQYLDLTCRWSDPVQAARILTTLAEVYQQEDSSRGTQKTERMIAFINGNLVTMEQRMDDAEKAVKEFLAQHKLVNASADNQQVLDQISSMETARQEKLLRSQALGEIGHMLDKASYSSFGALLSGVDKALVDNWGSLEVARQELKSKLKRLQASFTPEYPEVKVVRDALEENAKALDQLKHQAKEAIIQNQVLLGKKASLLAESIHKLEKNTGLDPEVQSQIMRLKRKSSVAEGLYSFLLKKKEEMGISNAGNISSATVLDEPLPGGQVSPNLRRLAAGGGMLGLLLAGLLGFMRERMDVGIKSVEELEQGTGLYVHGAIPHHKEAEEESGLVALTRWGSPDAEAYRTLRTSIQLSSLEHQASSIFITSSGPGEGKSTTAANLAVTLARAGKRTLIVDCDMRRAVQHSLLHVPQEPGLAEVLEQKTDWRPYVRNTEIDGLFLLPAGKTPPNPSELLGREYMVTLIDEVKLAYDFVLFDVPPILVVSDAALLASHVDGVLVLVRAGMASISDVNRAQTQMQRVGGRVLGAIYNSFDKKKVDGYGGYGRYGRYGYGGYGYYNHDEERTAPSNPVAALWQRLTKKRANKG